MTKTKAEIAAEAFRAALEYSETRQVHNAMTIFQFREALRLAYLAGIASERERVRKQKPDGYAAFYLDNFQMFWQHGGPTIDELTYNCSEETKAKWRIVPVKLLELTPEGE